MPPAACLVAQKTMIPPPVTTAPMISPASDSFAKDAIIAWFRGEFAAANAIIDALLGHLTQLEGGESAAYESAFSAIHQRRLNWIPIIQMQKHFSIADVTGELKKVAVKKTEECVVVKEKETFDATSFIEKVEDLVESDENGGGEVVNEDHSPPESEITDTGSQEVQHFPEHVDICTNHEDCEGRRTEIRMTKGFVAKEHVKGHMVNVVRGLKLYEDIFTEVELSKLNDFVNELRVAGQNGELSGEAFILYNQQVKGSKRELIQLGVPIFGRVKGDTTNEMQKSHVEPIPALLDSVIEHLTQWRLFRENEKPNSCIINFFDEGEYSQPFLKPPHVEQPLSTLLLSESTMGFGRSLMSDREGNYKGPLMLSLKEGSLLVMRGNSSDTARHVMCASANKRVSITFFRVRSERESQLPESTLFNKEMSLWQPAIVPTLYPISYNNFPPMMNTITKWDPHHAPMVMLAPMRPMVMPTPRRMSSQGGTGVFLPWANVPTRKHHTKHLPPRAQRGRFLALPSPVDTRKAECSDSGSTSS